MTTRQRFPALLLSAFVPMAVAAGPSTLSSVGPGPGAQPVVSLPPLIAEVRAATERYRDVNAALAEGFVPATPCVSGPDFGAMGVHFLLPGRLAGGVLSADQPQALIYEPLPGGGLRFVAVEFLVLAGTWAKQHPGSGPPALAGHLLNYVDAPNRFGLEAFYELHVWAWQQNPVGSFADWNTRVSCDQQPTG